MTDLISVGATGIRNKLKTSADITAKVFVSNGLDDGYKIFLEAASGQTNTPYILMHHIWGGDLNQAPSQSFDMTFRVDAVAENLPDALEISGYIRSALHEQTVLYPDGWGDWAGVTATGNYLEQLVVQGIQVWASGPYVHLRGAKSS